jgi:hypothetical protein
MVASRSMATARPTPIPLSCTIDMVANGKATSHEENHDAADPGEDGRPRVRRAPAASSPGQMSFASHTDKLSRVERTRK